MRRRTLLGGLAAVLAGGVGYRAVFPDPHFESATGVIEPASDAPLADGLRTGGSNRSYASLVWDAPEDHLRSDATGPVPEQVRTGVSDDTFVAVAQYRSTPAAPRRLGVPLDGPRWRFPRTLVVPTTVEESGSLADVGDDDRRRELLSADELIATIAIEVGPRPAVRPEDVRLVLRSAVDG